MKELTDFKRNILQEHKTLLKDDIDIILNEVITWEIMSF